MKLWMLRSGLTLNAQNSARDNPLTTFSSISARLQSGSSANCCNLMKPFWLYYSEAVKANCSRRKALMSSSLVKTGFVGTLALAAALSVGSAFAAGKTQTYTGEVGDAMCGAKHDMGGSNAECTKTCVKQGSKYALVDGDKVYTLDTKDKAALDELEKLAGQKATVTGTATGTTIAVSSVKAAH